MSWEERFGLVCGWAACFRLSSGDGGVTDACGRVPYHRMATDSHAGRAAPAAGAGPDLSAENLLGLAKYTLELFNPSHRLATRNLEEVLCALRHDFRSRRARLQCVAVPQQAVRSLSGGSAANSEACAVVGSRAAITLGIPVDGACLVFASKCLCPLASAKDCGTKCQARAQAPKSYALHIASNCRVPPYQLLVDETAYHNIKSCLFGSSLYSEERMTVNIRRCDHITDGTRFSLNYATKAVVSWIEQPHIVDDSVFAASLSGFFEVPRHLHKGDIFKVQLSDYAPEVLLAPGKFAIDSLYFVVKNIEGPGYRGVRNPGESVGYVVAKEETSLVQDVNSHCYLPSTTLARNSNPNNILHKYPIGLKTQYDKLIRGILPFLRGSISGLKPTFLLTGPAGCGKRALVSSAAAHLGLNFWAVDCAEMRSGTPGQTVGKLKAIMSKAKQYSPCVVLMSNIQSLCRDQDGHNDYRVLDEFGDQLSTIKELKFPVIVIGTTPSATDLTSAFARIFLLEISVTAMEKEERKMQLMQIISQHNVKTSEKCIEEIAARCSGFLLGDLSELVTLAIRNAICNVKPTSETNADSNVAILTEAHFTTALDKMQSAYAGSIGAPKIPSVMWKDIGGLENVKKEILQTVTMPLKHPELTAGGLSRSGILLYGPPGTGKTLLAKAVATECNLNFLSVKGPELLNMYVGQSEANVREIFERAREASPCIIFFDELDALAPNRGRSGDSGGVMDRVVSQLLSEMDGMNKSALLFVIGATNRPDLIDPALLRPGRFDKLLYVGAYEDISSKMSVLSALTRKFKLNSDVDLEAISNKLPSEVTGADMYAVCSRAWLEAVRKIIKQIQDGNVSNPVDVEVNQEDFENAVLDMAPSVSTEDMLYFKGLQQQMSALPAK